MHLTTSFIGRLAAGMATVALVAVSCTQDFDEFFQGAGPTGGGGSGGTVTTGGGGSGGGSGCTTPADCPGVDTDCAYSSCAPNGDCGRETAPAAEPCNDDGGQVCDGAGHCVECSTADQCEVDEACQANLCVPLACANSVQDGEETDIDCGGSDCSSCANGLTCVLFSDCQSGFCDNGSCAACGGDGDCQADNWCDVDVCFPKKPNGDPCGAANECTSDQCAGDDGVCCDEACAASCRACLQAKTGSPDGTCEFVSSATDPDGECGASDPSSCGSSGAGCTGSTTACILHDDTTECVAQTCTGSTLSLARQCDGAGTCEVGQLQLCSPYTCNGGGSACLTSCTDSNDCAAGFYCDGGNTCQQATKQPGDPCGSPAECISGSCPPEDGVCCNQACDGQCEACLQSKTGSADGQCAAIQNNTDPDQECQDTGGPCGPNGNGCTGPFGSTYCRGYTCDCDEQYGHAAILEQCFQTPGGCQLRVDTTSASCRTICEAGGGSCTAVYNDNPDGTCNPNFGEQVTCDTSNLSSAICYCSRGCGGNTACVSPLVCINDLCQ